MFQNSDGTTAAALESPVGLQLDLSRNLTLGSNIVTPAANSTFTSDTGFWTKDAGVTISGGSANWTAAVSTSQLYKTGQLTVGKYYEATFTISSITTGGLRCNFGGNLGTLRTTAGTYTERLVATGSGTMAIYSSGASTTASVTLVSFFEVTGTHRLQATSANRPTLSARYNLLTKTEQFNTTASWTVANVTVVANAAVAPDGTTTADKIYPNTTGTNRFIYQTLSLASGLYKWSFRAKAAEKTIAYIDFTGAGTTQAFFNLTTGAVGTVAAGYAATITSLGDGWYECSGTNNTASAYSFGGVYGVADANGSATVTANGTDGIYIWGGDTRPANQATGLIPTYQRVDTSSVYDTVGFPQYLKYGGINSSLSTASINFTATAQMSVFSGVRKLATATSVFAEFGTNVAANNGSFAIFTGLDTTTDYAFYLRGSSNVYYAPSSYTPPITNTLSSQFNIAGASKATAIIPTVNNVTVQTGGAGTTAGTGNFSTYPLYFGARAGASFFFNGLEFQTIIVGKTLTATEIANTETYVNSKTKAY
jgi:hypothetical protein